MSCQFVLKSNLILLSRSSNLVFCDCGLTESGLSSFCSGAKVLIYSESFNLVQFSECLGCRLLTNYNFSKVTLNTIPVIIIILLGFRSQQEAAAASPRLKSLSCVGTGLAATTNTEHTLQPAWAESRLP